MKVLKYLPFKACFLQELASLFNLPDIVVFFLLRRNGYLQCKNKFSAEKYAPLSSVGLLLSKGMKGCRLGKQSCCRRPNWGKERWKEKQGNWLLFTLNLPLNMNFFLTCRDMGLEKAWHTYSSLSFWKSRMEECTSWYTNEKNIW